MALINLGPRRNRGAAAMGPNGRRANHLPGANYAVIATANRFAFLGTCKPDAADMLEGEDEDPICNDPQSEDAATVRGRLIEVITTALGL